MLLQQGFLPSRWAPAPVCSRCSARSGAQRNKGSGCCRPVNSHDRFGAAVEQQVGGRRPAWLPCAPHPERSVSPARATAAAADAPPHEASSSRPRPAGAAGGRAGAGPAGEERQAAPQADDSRRSSLRPRLVPRYAHRPLPPPRAPCSRAPSCACGRCAARCSGTSGRAAGSSAGSSGSRSCCRRAPRRRCAARRPQPGAGADARPQPRLPRRAPGLRNPAPPTPCKAAHGAPLPPPTTPAPSSPSLPQAELPASSAEDPYLRRFSSPAAHQPYLDDPLAMGAFQWAAVAAMAGLAAPAAAC
jgi:hypothetical protein